jgi:hypothetical protein
MCHSFQQKTKKKIREEEILLLINRLHCITHPLLKDLRRTPLKMTGKITRKGTFFYRLHNPCWSIGT